MIYQNYISSGELALLLVSKAVLATFRSTTDFCPLILVTIVCQHPIPNVKQELARIYNQNAFPMSISFKLFDKVLCAQWFATASIVLHAQWFIYPNVFNTGYYQCGYVPLIFHIFMTHTHTLVTHYAMTRQCSHLFRLNHSTAATCWQTLWLLRKIKPYGTCSLIRAFFDHYLSLWFYHFHEGHSVLTTSCERHSWYERFYNHYTYLTIYICKGIYAYRHSSIHNQNTSVGRTSQASLYASCKRTPKLWSNLHWKCIVDIVFKDYMIALVNHVTFAHIVEHHHFRV